MKAFIKSKIDDCKIHELPKVVNNAGNLTSLNNGIEIPFEIKRVFYIFDIPAGESRGGHAHKNLHQFIIAVSGAFEVLIDDGEERRTIRLDRPYMGLHKIPGIWSELLNFSSGAVCLVLASEYYDENDYIRNPEEFIRLKKNIPE